MGKALREEKGEDLRGEKLNREWRENILGRKKEEKGHDLRGGKRPWGGRGGKDRKARSSQGGKRPLRSQGALLREERGKGSQHGKVANDLREEKREDLEGPSAGKGGKGSQQGQGEKILGRKREKISRGKGERISTGGKDLGKAKERGKGSQQGRRGKHLREKKGEDLGGKRP